MAHQVDALTANNVQDVLEGTALISAEKAESLAIYRDLGDGKTAEDREGASAIIEQIRRDVEQMPQIPQSNRPASTNASGP